MISKFFHGLQALSFLVFPFLPASNIFFPVGFVIAERSLYLPSLGFSMLVVVGFHRLLKLKKLVLLHLSLSPSGWYYIHSKWTIFPCSGVFFNLYHSLWLDATRTQVPIYFKYVLNVFNIHFKYLSDNAIVILKEGYYQINRFGKKLRNGDDWFCELTKHRQVASLGTIKWNR